MAQTDDIESVRAETLRKVGRNVVNFQKVEACLKFLVSVSNSQGTPSTIARLQRKKVARVRKESLGKLVTAFHRDILDDDSESNATPEFTEIWMSFAMKVLHDANSIRQRKLALSKLVKERNKLIHHDLVHFDYNSAQSCRKLIKILDVQNPRILEQLNALRVLIEAFKAQLAGMQAWVDSDDFLRQLQSAQAQV